MTMIQHVEKWFKAFLPSPFSIALLLTILTFLLAWLIPSSETSGFERGLELMHFWSDGLFEQGLLAFAVQMMLMLVLGHALALTKPVDNFIQFITQFCTNTARAAAIVTFFTVLVALFNWGLGLIFGAILARKVGEFSHRKGIGINYSLVGAGGYSGLMVWHGGISGSAPIKVAESGHISSLMNGVVTEEQMASFPDAISFSDTVFGSMNLYMMLSVIILLPVFMYWLGTRTKKVSVIPKVAPTEEKNNEHIEGAERLDYSTVFALFFGVLIVLYAIYLAIEGFEKSGFSFITPNYINLILLGLCLILHRTIRSFLKAIDDAIGGASGILIQFPLYFGIMGLMKYSGLVHEFSQFFVNHSNSFTFPIYTFFSSGLVNVFVPSGGGQWMVQGPIILQAASELGVSPSKAIMAMAYGDQVTNMLQPFWALPLLGITGLSAKTILPYTLALMLVGTVIFVSLLMFF